MRRALLGLSVFFVLWNVTASPKYRLPKWRDKQVVPKELERILISGTAEEVRKELESLPDYFIRGALDYQHSLLGLTARHNPDPEVISVLLEFGADPDYNDGDWGTALHLAARYNTNYKVIEVLARAVKDVNAVNNMLKRETPLHIAAEYNHRIHQTEGKSPTERTEQDPKAISALLSAGANPKLKNHLGKTPLQKAKKDPATPDAVINILSNPKSASGNNPAGSGFLRWCKSLFKKNPQSSAKNHIQTE